MMDNRNRTLRYKEWPKKTQGTPLKKVVIKSRGNNTDSSRVVVHNNNAASHVQPGRRHGSHQLVSDPTSELDVKFASADARHQKLR